MQKSFEQSLLYIEFKKSTIKINKDALFDGDRLEQNYLLMIYFPQYKKK